MVKCPTWEEAPGGGRPLHQAPPLPQPRHWRLLRRSEGLSPHRSSLSADVLGTNRLVLKREIYTCAVMIEAGERRLLHGSAGNKGAAPAPPRKQSKTFACRKLAAATFYPFVVTIEANQLILVGALTQMAPGSCSLHHVCPFSLSLPPSLFNQLVLSRRAPPVGARSCSRCLPVKGEFSGHCCWLGGGQALGSCKGPRDRR